MHEVVAHAARRRLADRDDRHGHADGERRRRRVRSAAHRAAATRRSSCRAARTARTASPVLLSRPAPHRGRRARRAVLLGEGRRLRRRLRRPGAPNRPAFSLTCSSRRRPGPVGRVGRHRGRPRATSGTAPASGRVHDRRPRPRPEPRGDHPGPHHPRRHRPRRAGRRLLVPGAHAQARRGQAALDEDRPGPAEPRRRPPLAGGRRRRPRPGTTPTTRPWPASARPSRSTTTCLARCTSSRRPRTAPTSTSWRSRPPAR